MTDPQLLSTVGAVEWTIDVGARGDANAKLELEIQID
jgi:hypothetical protein